MSQGDNHTVWKGTLLSPRTVLHLPKGAQVLSVGVQGSQIVLWAEVNPANECEDRVFNAINTGAQLPPDRLSFYGTVHVGGVEDAPIVWHIYEVES